MKLVAGSNTSRVCVFLLLVAGLAQAEPVKVRHIEGRIRGFLVLRDEAGGIIASGDLRQLSTGARVTSELSFQFKDGSAHQETVVFSQKGTFRLLTYKLVQKGPAFKRPTELSVNRSTGKVVIHYTDEDGKRETIDEKMEIPDDLANGLVPTLMSDIDSGTQKATLSMLVSTPKPRIVKLEISPAGEETFTIGGSPRKSLRYVIKVNIGGISGVVAPLVGKQPPDTHMWVSVGKAPGFLKSAGPLFEGGPVWQIELASPVWPKGE